MQRTIQDLAKIGDKYYLTLMQVDEPTEGWVILDGAGRQTGPPWKKFGEAMTFEELERALLEFDDGSAKLAGYAVKRKSD